MAGCAKNETAPPRTITQSQRAFEQKARDEFELKDIKTRIVGETFWVYLPTKTPLFDYEAQKESNDGEQVKRQQFAVHYVDGDYKNRNFNFEYDIVDKKKSNKEDYGYSSSYTDAYLKMQNNIFTAISDCFFGSKAVAGEKEPKFVVIVITDIKKGIESRVTFYLEDFKRYMTGDLPNDEYMKRFLADTKGGQSLIGDETGSHITYRDIPMTEFLSKQIVNRINFKFQHSDFAPDTEYDKTIVGIVADTLHYYNFQDYAELRLNNLRLNKKYIFNKEQVKTFGDDSSAEDKSKGKLIHIIFEDGKAKIQGEDQNTTSEKPAAATTTTNSTTSR